ncbi:hypothetical protein J19TS2_36750 [Cohnella xylanilytica]|uniref:chitobiase/beta-hexosaminidase C-terminal domain-containing protein n=1 Tax=Cohnella xylanilytica TaxID=557555 RepID=UPI001B2A6D98|nr:chitobiase/beta-hexosaminidase C-terminal domain-containing protein [Cohnella xylanilytica]GIO14120.1 hypothetical protein J19TS2_36750 [Cohnella xylanilytica]
MNRVKHSVARTAAALTLAASLLLPSAIPAGASAAAEIGAEEIGGASEPIRAAVRVHPDQVVQDDFLGVGVNVIPANLMKGTTQFGYTEAHWEMDRKRILTVRPKVARVWFQIDWMEPEKGVYTWDSPEMKGFYAYLDAFKEAGTEIELDFGWKNGSKVHDWFTFPDVPQAESAPADLDAYAASASALLKHLLDERGYSNVKYLTFYNEPNGSWDYEVPGDQQAYYAEMARKASDRLAADGLRSRVQIWGPEESGAPAWTQYMSEHAGDVFDAYSFHVYGESYDGLGGQIRTRKNFVQGKPVHLTEFGWAGDNDSNWNAGYANSVIQAANSGVGSALIWQLNGTWSPDPFGGTNGNYTMWDSLLLGMQPRKTFYIGGLLTRYIPAHSQVLKVETDSPDVRAAAFKSPDGNYTILLESKEGAAKDVSFDFGSLAVNKTFAKHEYRSDVVPEGNAVLPESSGSFRAGTSFRDAGIGGDYSVIVYTTAPSATQVKVSPLTPTVKSGDKLQLSAEVVDNAGGFAWSIVGDKKGDPKNKGAINKNTGVYHAPNVTDETYVAVKAASVRDPSAYAISLVKVLPKSVPSTVEAPRFSLAPGPYPSAEALFLTSATPGAQIRYTTDGSTPTESSSLYTKPIILNNGSLALYKAKAFKAGKKPSGTASAFYQIGDVSNSPDGYTFCMYEGQGRCDFQGEAIVAFGADGLFNYKVLTDGTECSADVFGDPAPGVPKRCFYSPDVPEELPVVTFYNAGFEKPATSSARWGPMTNGWTFTERAGVQHNGSVFQAPDAPQGVQTGYLKTDGGVNGWFSQSINFKPGTYQMSFKAAKRMSFGGTQTFDVLFDDTVIGSYAPTTGEYVLYRTEPFATEGGRHVIKFQAASTTGDNTAFLDDVRITLPVQPEAPYAANGSFETPAVADGEALAGPTAGWSFDANSGVIRGSGGQGAPRAPLGVQAAYVTDGGSFVQSVEFPAGTYALNFRAAAGGTRAIEVRVDDRVVGTYTPPAGSYKAFGTDFFTVDAGAHEIRFSAAGGEGTAWIDGVGIERIAIPEQAEIGNGGFETPAVTNGNGVKFGGTAGPWTFAATAGVIRNGSVFGAADAPEGTQAGYLQTVNGAPGEFSQEALFPAGTYAITFQASRRAGFGGQQKFTVYVDDQAVGSFAPSSGSYAAYTTDRFTFAAPGKHKVRFAATTTTGDNTAFIDDIRIVPAPAPATELEPSAETDAAPGPEAEPDAVPGPAVEPDAAPGPAPESVPAP